MLFVPHKNVSAVLNHFALADASEEEDDEEEPEEVRGAWEELIIIQREQQRWVFSILNNIFCNWETTSP